jgi:putative transposase
VREPFTQLYLHLVWATCDRLPLITPDIREPVYACVKAKCLELKADMLAIGGMNDHIHVLVRFPTTITISDLVKHLKGASSHLVNHRLQGWESAFKWQGAYGAFTVSRADGKRVREYILNQEQHHADKTCESAWELEPQAME